LVLNVADMWICVICGDRGGKAVWEFFSGVGG